MFVERFPQFDLIYLQNRGRLQKQVWWYWRIGETERKGGYNTGIASPEASVRNLPSAEVGEVAYLVRPSEAPNAPPIYIFNMITKELHYDLPTMETMRWTLESLRRLCDQFGVKELAMPRIGCGLDKLEWRRVRRMIEDVFGDSDVEISVFYL